MRLPVWGQWTSDELASPTLAGVYSRRAVGEPDGGTTGAPAAAARAVGEPEGPSTLLRSREPWVDRCAGRSNSSKWVAAKNTNMAGVHSRNLSFSFGGVRLGCVGLCGARPAPRRQVLPASDDAGGRGRGAGKHSENELWSLRLGGHAAARAVGEPDGPSTLLRSCEPGVQEVPTIRESHSTSSSLFRLKPANLGGLPRPF